ncbi:uncharacterized protein LOC129720333 [Wyeomyia smithii]|uniref:uncharacterized protein LOC129720333 n=1 Tax=Wyeomyia smithii TaxID=174621 RepID=UPI002467FA82|nr:uncharacterized protein LOC129720333 [Wyeomyia smithii]
MFSGLEMLLDAATQMEKRCLPDSDPTSERSFELDVRKSRNQKRCNDHQYAKQPESSFVHTGANVMYTTFPFGSTSNSGIVKRFPFSDISSEYFLAAYILPKKNEAEEPIKLTDIMVFRYSTSSPGIVLYKHDVRETSFKRTNIISCADLMPIGIDLIELHNIEDGLIILPDAKLADLKALLPYIKNKSYYQTFLKTLVPAKRGRKKKSNQIDHLENDMDPPESDGEPIAEY